MVKCKSQRDLYWKIAWPAALEGLLIVLLSSIDLLMISSIGPIAVAAVGIFSQPKMVLLCVSRSMAIATTATIALWSGKGEYHKLSNFMKQSVAIILGVSSVLCVVTAIGMEPILMGAGAQKEYLDQAVTYAQITNISLIFQALAIIINSGLTGLGRTRAMLVANVSGNVVNILLNALLIYLFNQGVRGAAWATVIGSMVTLGCSVVFASHKESAITLRGGHGWIPTRETIKVIVGIFKGAFMEQGCERIGMFLYSYFVAQLGAISFSVHCICMTLCDVFYNFGQGFSKASLTLAARGARRDEVGGEETLIRSVTPLCLAWAFIAAILYFFLRRQFMMAYSQEEEVVILGSKILVLVAVSCFPQTFSLCYSGLLRGMGYTRYVAKYSFWSIAIMRPIITYFFIFVWNMDLYGAWTALLIDQTLRMLCATYKLKRLCQHRSSSFL